MDPLDNASWIHGFFNQQCKNTNARRRAGVNETAIGFLVGTLNRWTTKRIWIAEINFWRMPSESLHLYEHDLYATHLFIIMRRNTDSSRITALK